MKMKTQLMGWAVAALMSSAAIAVAADNQVVPDAKPPVKAKVKRHDHNAENKASAPGQQADPSSRTTKPGHDHRKENKGGG